MEEKIYKELVKMNKLLVAIYSKDMKQSEKIEWLGSIDFAPKDIADLVGASNNVVSVALNRVKKRVKKNND